MTRMIIQGYKCRRCGHHWSPRNGSGYRDRSHPRHCPKCGTPYWDRPRREEIAGRPDEEVRELAFVQLEGYHCERCSYRWGPRNGSGRWSGTDPKSCPKCRSTLWNRPRERDLPAAKRAVQWNPPRAARAKKNRRDQG